MAKPKVKWHGKEVEAALIAAITDRLNAAVQLVRNDVVQSLNRSQPIRRTAKGTAIGLDPSKPGEAPKRLEGQLIQNIATKVTRKAGVIRGVIFTTLPYARRLELGFVGTDSRGRMISQGPRPFLRPAFERQKEKIKQLFHKPEVKAR